MTGKALGRLFFVGLCVFAGSAEAKSGEDWLFPSHPSQEPSLPMRCLASVDFMYLEGLSTASNSTDSDRFTRQGGSLGAECFFNFWQRRIPWFHLGLETRYYTGGITVNHHTAYLDAVAAGTEIGAILKAKAFAATKYVDFGLYVGGEITPDGRLNISKLEIPLGGAVLDFSKFADEHLFVTGSLRTFEAGAFSRIKIWRKSTFTGLSLTLDVLWQMYFVTAQVVIDDVAKNALAAVGYYYERLVLTQFTAHAYFITPGLEYCYNQVCAYVTMPWGVANKDVWGGAVHAGVRIILGP